MSGVRRAIAVDFSWLEIQVGGDQGIVREVLSIFSEQARTVLQALDPSGSSDAWRQAAHSLKGSALGIGAGELAEACNAAELAEHASVLEKKMHRVRIADCLGSALIDISGYMSAR